jgi:hypothetical protein
MEAMQAAEIQCWCLIYEAAILQSHRIGGNEK